MIQEYIKETHWSCWPFWVLDLTPQASMQDIEKAARDLTAKIEFGMDKAKKFNTPIGAFERDEYLIREAKSSLQNPKLRLLAEFWYVEPNEIEAQSEGVQLTQNDWLKLLRVN